MKVLDSEMMKLVTSSGLPFGLPMLAGWGIQGIAILWAAGRCQDPDFHISQKDLVEYVLQDPSSPRKIFVAIFIPIPSILKNKHRKKKKKKKRKKKEGEKKERKKEKASNEEKKRKKKGADNAAA